jgi:branched-chain amino acid transport system ATP-binding protein
MGQAILLIDSNHGALMRIADRHYIMEKGRITWTGDSTELAAAEDVRHRYLGV